MRSRPTPGCSTVGERERDYFLFPKLKMKLKGLHFADVAEIQEAITDELKKAQKEEFSAAFQTVRLRKSLYICQWSLF
jgi:hypothetical protein